MKILLLLVILLVPQVVYGDMNIECKEWRTTSTHLDGGKVTVKSKPPKNPMSLRLTMSSEVLTIQGNVGTAKAIPIVQPNFHTRIPYAAFVEMTLYGNSILWKVFLYKNGAAIVIQQKAYTLARLPVMYTSVYACRYSKGTES